MITRSSLFKFLRDYASIIVLAGLAIILISCQLESLLPPSTPTAAPTRTMTRPPAALVNTPLPTTAPIIPTVPPTPVQLVATAKENVRIRALPSTSAAILTVLNKGATAQAVGRTAAADWVQVVVPSNPNQRGWVSAEFVTLSGPLETLAVVSPSANPPGASQVPARTPTRPPYPYP